MAVWYLDALQWEAEELEDGTVEPFVSELEGFASGKKVALFGSYDWGDGEWMRTWLKEWNRLAHRSSAEKDLSATEHREQMQ